MNYPLQLTFKIIALAPQLRVADAAGNQIAYVKQKMFKLKEHVEVFADDSKAHKFCDIRTDKIIDWSACYRFSDAQGKDFGAVRRKGGRSLWRAHYEILDGDRHLYTIREENGWIKVADSLLGGIPILGSATGYFLNPSYLISTPDGSPILRVKKQPAMWEGKFTIEQLSDVPEQDEVRCLMSIIMMTLLERQRG
ncbi:MAG: hypothetical protein ACI8XO_001861 [Verrucomicrobiales bacterium]|jgi:uncharacterized protein YxjI